MTDEPLGEKRLQGIIKRASDATPGPWYSHEGSITYGEIKYGYGTYTLCHIQHAHNPDMWNSQDQADANFIACARRDIPDLIKEIERLKAKHE